MDSIYLLKPDAETFRLTRAMLDEKTGWIRKPSVRRDELIEKALGLEGDRFFFLTALVLGHREIIPREVLQRTSKKGVRSIPTAVKEVEHDLTRSVKGFKEMDGETQKGAESGMALEKEKLEALLHEALAGMRKELEFPSVNPTRWSYEISDDFVESIEDPECRAFLVAMQTAYKKPIFQETFEKISERLLKYPSGAKVRERLEATRTREHLSAVATISEEGDAYLGAVNPDGQLVRMRASTFLNLVERHGSPMCIADLDGFWPRGSKPKAGLNRHREGMVVGKFSPAMSKLDVNCTVGKEETCRDQATFLIDPDDVVLHYVVLRRLRDDKARFDRLRDLAECMVVPDPHNLDE